MTLQGLAYIHPSAFCGQICPIIILALGIALDAAIVLPLSRGNIGGLVETGVFGLLDVPDEFVEKLLLTGELLYSLFHELKYFFLFTLA